MARVADWVKKAEVDWKSAAALGRRRRDPLPDAVCFHRQQSAEKYPKAILSAHRALPPRVHDLVQLLDLCVALDPSMSRHGPACHELNSYSVVIRYPGVDTTVAEARSALSTMRVLRRAYRKKLGL